MFDLGWSEILVIAVVGILVVGPKDLPRLMKGIGEWVAKDRDAYQYLVESIRRFPDQRTFAAMIEAAGFKRVTFTNFTGGVAALHQGWAI